MLNWPAVALVGLQAARSIQNPLFSSSAKTINKKVLYFGVII
jgi:hypothetical protein